MLWNYNHFIHSPPIFKGSNVIGQINIIINKMYIFVENPMQTITAWSLELMDFTRDRFPPLWCFARTLLQLTSVVVCLWLFLPLVLSSASEMHAQSGWDQKETPGLFLLYVLGHRPFELSAVQSSLLYLTESGHRVYSCALQNSSGCFCLLNSSNPGSCHHTAPPCFTDEHELFQAFPYFFLPIILIHLALNFSCSKNCIFRSSLAIRWLF